MRLWDSSAPDETQVAYAQLYLKEEIQAEALVRNLPGFARFLPLAALFHGQTVHVTNIARKASVARTIVAGYLDILEETLLCFRLPAYEAKLRVRERKLPKWYWCDPGIVRAMKRTSGGVTPEERGALFEGLVAQLLRAVAALSGLRRRIIVYPRGPVMQTTDGIEIVPFQHFADQLATNAL